IASVFIRIVEKRALNLGGALAFSMIGTMTMFISITAGLFIITDFKNNTIRNKIIIGHSRTKIYLANLIISLTVAFIYQMAFWLTLIGLCKTIMRFDDFPSKEIFQNMLLTMAIIFAFTSCFVFICTTLKNTGGFALSLMLDTVVSMLVLLVMIIPKKEISKILSIAVPSMQKNSLSNNPTVVPDNIWWMILIDIGICVVVTIAGIEIFKRSDLK
ncbi:hypothetical protein, partial [Ruminococcus flavefaciens]|uniref:hypothetical protein n=1 Tax=Ruminococcus flavefaciens TaxID=1265 RepID=UPI0026EE4152